MARWVATRRFRALLPWQSWTILIYMTTTTSEVTEPPPTDALPERAALIAVAVTVLIFGVLSMLGVPDGSAAPLVLSDARLARALGVQLVISGTLGMWLWRRGWRPQRTATRPFAGMDLLRALVLWVVALLGVAVWLLVCRALFPDLFTVALGTQIIGRPSLPLVVPFVIFNAVFEELLWLSLCLVAFRRFGVGVAAAMSVGLRVMLHAYQGPLVLITIVPMGIAFTAYYLRTRRLWPVVLAHAFQDLLALGALASGWSRPGTI
jgi:membrane protease YdiL (CAAX protease family)